MEWCAGDEGENGDGFSGASTESVNAGGDDENARLNGENRDETAGSGEDGGGNGFGEGECEHATTAIGTDDDDNRVCLPPFTEDTGVAVDMNGKEPVEYFQLYFTEELQMPLLHETNRYGDQYIESHEQHLLTHPRARAHDFIKRRLTISDMLRFLGLIIAMGVVCLPKIPQYWSTRWPFQSTNFSRVMSRDRFQLVLKFFHLIDNMEQVPRGQPGHDKLFKLRPLLEYLIPRFQSMFTPNREIAVDESMMGYKGSLSFLQYMPKKAKKLGDEGVGIS